MPRISYADMSLIDDPAVIESVERARRVGTPRPEIQLIMAHNPTAMKAFDALWFTAFKQGALEHELKELVRVRVAKQLECVYCGTQRAVAETVERIPSQLVSEERYDALDDYEGSPLFTDRERIALRYADAITWDPGSADDAMWQDLHAQFTPTQLVELGVVTAIFAGGQRWTHMLDIRHGDDPQGTLGIGYRADLAAANQVSRIPAGSSGAGGAS